jgi:outer membrane protein OmpA-like peptidoglycan-associated protein
LIVKLHSKLMGVAAAAALLAGQAWGATAPDEQVVFPEVGSEWLQGGTFVNVENLRRVAPGLQKDQLYDLLGRPHFKTGMFGVKEWDYLFNFRTGKGSEFVSCQYKVRFDDNYVARSFYWKDPACASFLAAPVATPAPMATPVAAAAPVKRTKLGTDGMFRFGGGKLQDLQPQGRKRVEALAAEIQRDVKSIQSITVTGHADRIGSPAANNALSQQRANTVRDLLVRGGLDGSVILASGAGQSQPVVACEGTRKTPELVNCLQPNRRVEVEVVGH